MFLETNIPKTTLCLDGDGVDFGDPMSDNVILQDRISKLQATLIGGGNRCGHKPELPRTYLRPDNHKSRPSVLEEAIKKLVSVYHYPKKFISRLATFHPHNRQKRSERREAVMSVSQVLLHYLELSTLRVGVYTASNHFMPLDLLYIAKKAGLSLIRARRALTDLVKAGYLKVSRRITKGDNGKVRGAPSIRELAAQFFIDLGVDVKHLFFTREWKRKQQEKSLAKKARKRLVGLVKTLSSVGNGNVKTGSRKTGSESNKAVIDQALTLHYANPVYPPSYYLKELLRLKE